MVLAYAQNAMEHFAFEIKKAKRAYPYLWSLCLNPPHTPRAVDDRVLRYDFTGVDLTEGSNDTATGEDYIPTDVS